MAQEPAATEIICFKDFLEQWKSKLMGQMCLPGNDNLTALNCREYMAEDFTQTFEEFTSEHMPLDVLMELETECSPATLICDNEPPEAMNLVTDCSLDVDLLCVQQQKVELERRKEDSIYRCKAVDKMKYRKRDGPWKHSKLQPGSSWFQQSEEEHARNVNVSLPDVLITIQIYRPFTKKKNLCLEQEFNVVGQQFLTELRDKICCVSDHVTVGDFSENPDNPCDTVAKDLFKSGFFFIEGVFYNDMRDPSNKDYSRLIIEWSKDPSRCVGPFDSRIMEETQFINLNARLGQPYVYVHQGDCEHLVIFTDIRMLHPEDCHLLNMYPLSVFTSRERQPKCRVCQLYLAKWVTWGSQLAPEDPCFFCETCFRALHYDSNGKKIVSDMRVYPVQNIRELKKQTTGIKLQ